MSHAANPQPISPVDQPVDAVAAIFNWTADAGKNYELQVARDAAFSDISLTLNAGAADTATLYDLLPSSEATLFWRVRSIDGGGAGEWSSPAAFVASSRAMAARPRTPAKQGSRPSHSSAASPSPAPAGSVAAPATAGAIESIDGTTSQAMVTTAIAVGLVSFVVLMLILAALV